MALKWFTGFEGRNTGMTDLTNGPSPLFTDALCQGVTTTNPGSGTRALGLSSASDYAYKTGFSNDATVVFGGRFRFASFSDAGRVFLALSDGSPVTAGNVNLGLAFTTGGKLQAYRGRALGSNSGGTQLGSDSLTTLSTNTYYYIEVRVVHSDTVGVVQVRVGGTTGTDYLSLTGQDTVAGSNAYSNAFGLNGAGSGGLQVDDCYFDTQLYGDCKVTGTAASTGNGTHTDGTPSTGTDRGAVVDDDPVSISDYVTLSTVGHKFTVNFPALSGVAGTIIGLNLHNYVQKTDAGTCDCAGQTLIGSTLYDGTTRNVNTSVGWNTDLYPASPDTLSTWTSTEINNAEFGCKRAA